MKTGEILIYQIYYDFFNYMLKCKHMKSFVKCPTIDLIFLRWLTLCYAKRSRNTNTHNLILTYTHTHFIFYLFLWVHKAVLAELTQTEVIQSRTILFSKWNNEKCIIPKFYFPWKLENVNWYKVVIIKEESVEKGNLLLLLKKLPNSFSVT